jgi:hypothetical protein
MFSLMVERDLIPCNDEGHTMKKQTVVHNIEAGLYHNYDADSLRGKPARAL